MSIRRNSNIDLFVFDLFDFKIYVFGFELIDVFVFLNILNILIYVYCFCC